MFIKNKKKITPFLATFAIAISFKSNITFAQLEKNDAFWDSDGFPDSIVNNMAFYYDPSISTYGYTWHATQAITDWDASPYADVDFYQVTSYDNADTRFFAGNYTWADWNGVMNPYDKNGNNVGDQYDTPGVVFYKCHVLLNHYQMSLKDYSGNARKKVATHELGHTLNLRHNIGSVMDSNPEGYYQSPTKIDYDNIGWAY